MDGAHPLKPGVTRHADELGENDDHQTGCNIAHQARAEAMRGRYRLMLAFEMKQGPHETTLAARACTITNETEVNPDSPEAAR